MQTHKITGLFNYIAAMFILLFSPPSLAIPAIATSSGQHAPVAMSIHETLHKANIDAIKKTLAIIEEHFKDIPTDKSGDIAIIKKDLKTYLAEMKNAPIKDATKQRPKVQGFSELALEITHDGHVAPRELEQWKTAFAERNNLAAHIPSILDGTATSQEAVHKNEHQELEDAAKKAFQANTPTNSQTPR